MKIILASNSPRRKVLLSEANIQFIVKSKNIPENWDNKFSPISTALSLAYQKGEIIANEEQSSIVLSADTIVALENEIIGKPKNIYDAREIICKLNGNIHKVITAFSIICLEKSIKYLNYDISYVKFKDLLDFQIDEYIKTDEPYDKAGAYGIQGLGSNLVEYYDGDINNIIGLPIKKVVNSLNKIFGE
ncbi:MAG: Maf family protein [Filifactoraceae bacterium]